MIRDPAGESARLLEDGGGDGAALAAADVARAPDMPTDKVPTVTLGKTGQKVTKLGLGTSWVLSFQFVQCGSIPGCVISTPRNRMRRATRKRSWARSSSGPALPKQVYLVSKGHTGRARGAEAAKALEKGLHASLSGCATDYVTPITSTASQAIRLTS